MIEQNIELLKKQLSKLKNLTPNTGRMNLCISPYEVDAWIAGAKGTMERIFGKDSLKIQELENIKNHAYRDISYGVLYELKIVISIGSSIIESCISEIESLGLPEGSANDTKGINLTLIQNQSTKQTIRLDILLKTFNEELTGKQLNEIQKLIDSKTEIEEKRKKIKDKLIEFGSNTLSNIIAGIITNPNLMGS